MVKDGPKLLERFQNFDCLQTYLPSDFPLHCFSFCLAFHMPKDRGAFKALCKPYSKGKTLLRERERLFRKRKDLSEREGFSNFFKNAVLDMVKLMMLVVTMVSSLHAEDYCEG